MQTAPLVDEYLAHCRLRGLAEKTVSQYQWALKPQSTERVSVASW